MQRFYVRILLQCDNFDIKDPYYKPYYFIVEAQSKRFVSPIIDRELKKQGFSQRLKYKIGTKINNKKFDEKLICWDSLISLYPKQINII